MNNVNWYVYHGKRLIARGFIDLLIEEETVFDNKNWWWKLTKMLEGKKNKKNKKTHKGNATKSRLPTYES